MLFARVIRYIERPTEVMKRSQRWNNLQKCQRQDHNSGGSDLCSNTIPLESLFPKMLNNYVLSVIISYFVGIGMLFDFENSDFLFLPGKKVQSGFTFPSKTNILKYCISSWIFGQWYNEDVTRFSSRGCLAYCFTINYLFNLRLQNFSHKTLHFSRVLWIDSVCRITV